VLSIGSLLATAPVASADHDGNVPPSNDRCDQAEPIQQLNQTYEGRTNRGAGVGECTTVGERLECATAEGPAPYGHTVWYAVTITTKGRFTVAASGASDVRTVPSGDLAALDTVIALYRSGQLQYLGCNDDGNPNVFGGSDLTAEVQPGDYFIQVGGFDYADTGPDRGFFRLSLAFAEDLDDDDDGVPDVRDCMPNNPAVHPNAPDVNNGVDDNCDRTVDPDEDSDGEARPPVGRDCGPNNPRIYPGAPEVRGNKVDEDCNDRKAPFRRIQAAPRLIGDLGPPFRFTAIEVDQVPKGALVRVRCTVRGRSCGSKNKRGQGRGRTVKVAALRKLLPPGTKITILVTKKNWIGAYTRYTLRAGKRPRRFDDCVNEGATRPRKGKCPGTR
jgi:hypothetical protein